MENNHKIDIMSEEFKKLLSNKEWKDKISDKNVDSITKERVSNEVIEELISTFWDKFNINKITLPNIWKQFFSICKKNIFLFKDNDNKLYISLELYIFLSRLIKVKGLCKYNKIYNFFDYEVNNMSSIFNSIFNMFDKLNMIPILINKYIEDPERANSLSKKNKWSDMTIEEIKLINSVRVYKFKDGYYKKQFSILVDKINFYKYYLSIIRNQFTHYPSLNHEIVGVQQTNYLLNYILKDLPILCPINYNNSNLYKSLILITLYLFLVYKEMLKCNLSNIQFFINK